MLPLSKDTPYTLFMEEPFIRCSVPEDEKTETDEDSDFMFLLESSSSSLPCIPLPPYEDVSPPPCSPCHDTIVAQKKAPPKPFIMLPRTLPDDVDPAQPSSSVSRPWRSSFGWYMDDVFEIDWSESK